MISVANHIEDARKKLIDLTLRNRLINYRPTKARTIKILNNENPSDIYEILVLKENQMRFRETKKNDTPSNIVPSQILHDQILIDDDNFDIESLEWKPQTQNNDIHSKQQRRFLETPYDLETLKKRLSRVAQDSKSFLEEQGYTILFLAIGFLEWYESSSSEKALRAPLILVPVELKRGEIRESFKIQWTNEDILTNISLKEKLKEQGIFLPEFEMPNEKWEIDKYFEKVKDAIESQERWNIFSDVYLDFFSFTKFVMYKDLDSTTWPEELKPATHPLITAIFNPDPNSLKIPGFDENEVDKRIRADSVYHILDADSSQIAAIEDIKAGKNLVIQGPPGTGKSQTIANAIADLLSQGKTILFISEKMAALEVVKERLDRVGLGDFCLELHSKKANIKELHKKLQGSLNIYPPQEIDILNRISRLEALKSDLNNYLEALYAPVGSRNITPFFLYGQNEKVKKHFSSNSRDMVRYYFSDADKISEQEWQAHINSLNDLIETLPKVQPIHQHPWYGCNPGMIHPSDEVRITTMIQNTNNAFFELQRKMEDLATITGLSYPGNINELQNAIGATKLFVSSNPIDRNLLLNNAWNQPNQQVELVIKEIVNYQKMHEQIVQRFKEEILDTDIKSFLDVFNQLAKKFVLIRVINSKYKALRQQAHSLYLQNNSPSDNVIINDFNQILKCIQKRDQIRGERELGRSLFGSLWKDENSNPVQLQKFSQWIIEFRRKMLEDVFTEKTVEMMSHGVSPANIEKATEDLTEAFQIFQEKKQFLFENLNFSPENRFLMKDEYVEFQKYQLLFSLWEENIQLLQTWSHYANYSQDCRTNLPCNFIDIIEEQNLLPEDVIPTFEGNYTEALLKKAFNEHPDLLRFFGDQHDHKIQSFAELDKEIIELNRRRLKWKLYQNLPDINVAASPNSELGILKQQFERKRGRMPIRQLLKNTCGLIQKINPCFMMGPLSVALFLDPRAIKFDVIIFDEASQVRPEDALGALLRGNQAAIIGDTKQLPPTTFFDKFIADEIDDPETVPSMTTGIESILNLCNVSFPSKTLRWHYRSRHESLIALSNAEFYDNKLFVYPSPMKRSKDIGLTLIHLPDAVYDRGKSQINRNEAEIVAKKVFEHYEKNPDKSLGIGTFNIKQQQAIIDEVTALRLQYPEMEKHFREDVPEKFFVKNLETIQGDERDVIFLSVGFGKDKNGKLYQNFGPLNQEGGERRLNVLITRAREKCVVFSNFTWRDLRINESSGLGIQILKAFLQYAESGDVACSTIPGGDSESPFEDAVYEFLVSKNYEVQKQIGCAGFRIDMAIVDPQQPGRYLIGIECDGAQYHSSKVARDRDRLRQQILNGLGWKIHRVWSTDWYRDSVETKKKLIETIERSKTRPPDKPESIKKDKSRVHGDAVGEPDSPPKFDNIPMNNNKVQIPDYQFYDFSHQDFNLTDISKQNLEKLIHNIVKIEGPIHIDELIQRLRRHSNNSRISSRIRERIFDSCSELSTRRAISQKGEFLWQSSPPDSILRQRAPEQEINIDWICDQEISEAIDHILKKQYATTREDLIVTTLRFFGIQRKTEKASSKVDDVIEQKIQTNDLHVLQNGKIDFKK